jgi:hypothetical protein
MRAGDAASNNPFKVAAHLIKTEGVRRLWVSNATVCLQVGPEMAANFFLYDRLKHALLADPNAPTRLEKFLVGGTAGWLAYSLTFPLLVAQFRLAVVPKGTYSGIIDLVRKTLQMEGVAGFFRGYTTASIRIFGIRGFDMLAFLALKNHFVKTVRMRNASRGNCQWRGVCVYKIDYIPFSHDHRIHCTRSSFSLHPGRIRYTQPVHAIWLVRCCCQSVYHCTSLRCTHSTGRSRRLDGMHICSCFCVISTIFVRF